MDAIYPILLNIDGKPVPTLQQFSLNTNEDYYRELKNVLKIKRAKNISFVRIGRIGDGGYIMADAFQKEGGVAYSFGISDDVSWDFMMSQFDYEIFMYDMTIDALPLESPVFHFFKEGIGGKKDVEKSLDTLESFIKRNGHENNHDMILKMDIEGAEWDFLETVLPATLNQFEQMVFEFHNLTAPKNFDEMNRTLGLLEKINSTHALIHLHGNNNGNYIKMENVGVIPDVLELAYLRRENHNFHDDAEIFLPTSFDTSNNIHLPDIPLGYWNKFF